MKNKLLLLSCVLLLLSNCGIRNKFTFYPDKKSEIEKENIPSHITEHFLNTSDKERIQTFLFSHKNKQPIVIYFHGNAGNVYHRFSHAQALYDMGLNVLLVSYRGYAKSSGKPSEKGIYNDGEAALNFAKDSLGYRLEDVYIYGRSLGTTVAVNLSQHQPIKGVVLITPLTSGKEMTKAMRLGAFKFIAGNSYNSYEKIDNLNSKLLIIHGDKDEVTPYYMAEKLYDKFEGDKKLVTIKNGMHNNLDKVDSTLFWGELEKFIFSD